MCTRACARVWCFIAMCTHVNTRVMCVEVQGEGQVEGEGEGEGECTG